MFARGGVISFVPALDTGSWRDPTIGLRPTLCGDRIAIQRKLLMSKSLQSLSMLSAIGLALAGSPHASEARGISARSGSPHISSQGNCWQPNATFGSTIFNTSCSFAALWHIPLVLDGSFNGWYSATVTATALTAADDVSCRMTSFDKNGNVMSASNLVPMLSFNGPSDRSFSVWVPDQGTATIDCFVKQGSSVHTVNY
jgi:hypothetical protein